MKARRGSCLAPGRPVLTLRAPPGPRGAGVFALTHRSVGVGGPSSGGARRAVSSGPHPGASPPHPSAGKSHHFYRRVVRTVRPAKSSCGDVVHTRSSPRTGPDTCGACAQRVHTRVGRGRGPGAAARSRVTRCDLFPRFRARILALLRGCGG